MNPAMRDSAWVETVAVVSALADGDKPTAARILRTSSHPAVTTEGLLHITSAVLCLPDVDPQRVLDIARACPPPPTIP